MMAVPAPPHQGNWGSDSEDDEQRKKRAEEVRGLPELGHEEQVPGQVDEFDDSCKPCSAAAHAIAVKVLDTVMWCKDSPVQAVLNTLVEGIKLRRQDKVSRAWVSVRLVSDASVG